MQFMVYGFTDLMIGSCRASSWMAFVFPKWGRTEWISVNTRMGEKHLSAILCLWNKKRYVRFIFIIIVYEEPVWRQETIFGSQFSPFTICPSIKGPWDWTNVVRLAQQTLLSTWDILLVQNNELLKSPNQIANSWRYHIQNKQAHDLCKSYFHS